MANERIGLVVFGEGGTGKSTLCNTLIGSNGTAFVENEGPEYKTLETIGKEGRYSNHVTFLIDTPRIREDDKYNADHLIQMVKYIRENHLVRGFILTRDVNCPRYSEKDRQLIGLISNIYPDFPWYKHIAIVWTHCYPEIKSKIEHWKPERKEFIGRFLKMYFNKEVTKEQANSIPNFFVDSIEARNDNTSSYIELCHLLDWAVKLKPIKEELAAMKEKFGEPKIEKRTRLEYGPKRIETWRKKMCRLYGPRKQYGRVYQTQTTIFEERICQEYTDGSKEYSDWKIVSSCEKEVIIDSW